MLVQKPAYGYVPASFFNRRGAVNKQGFYP